jgi:hypothetical protein
MWGMRVREVVVLLRIVCFSKGELAIALQTASDIELIKMGGLQPSKRRRIKTATSLHVAFTLFKSPYKLLWSWHATDYCAKATECTQRNRSSGPRRAECHLPQ